MNDDYRAVPAARVDRHGVAVTHATVLAPALGFVDIAVDEELVGRNIVTASVGDLDAVCVERHDKLGVDVAGQLFGSVVGELQDEYSGFLSPEG